MAEVLVTGANGFVGRALADALQRGGHNVCRAVRALPPGGVEGYLPVGDIGPRTDWGEAVARRDIVMHLAARVHVMRETAADPLTEFRKVNVEGTVGLAEAAVAVGATRFVYVSSIKVNGERTGASPFRASDAPDPQDAYAQSKFEAENALRGIAERTGLEVVIIRPPLVYGPGVKGNFRALLRLVELALPLPLGRCDNRRSFVGLGNLVDLLTRCAAHPAAVGQTFLAADGEDLSTAELVRRIARAFGKHARLLPVPPGWLRAVARLLGRTSVYERLCESLQVDAGHARRTLAWTPPHDVDAELARTVAAYRAAARS